MRKLITYIERIAFIAKWVGAIFLLFSIIGVFEYPKRKEFYKELQIKKTLPADSNITNQLLKDFGFPTEQVKLIETITLKGMTWGGSGHTVTGVVVAETKDGRSRTIGELNEVRSWTYSASETYNWLSFSFIVFGLIVESFVRVKGKKAGDSKTSS